ncbi:2-oxo acid dehydrogenase subunit E2 [Streptomyces sp. M19]
MVVGLPELLLGAIGRLDREFPECFGKPSGEAADPHRRADVGITIDTGTGLYIPVVRRAAELTPRELAETLMEFRKKALTRRFDEQDLRGGDIALSLHTEPDVVMAHTIVFPSTSAWSPSAECSRNSGWTPGRRRRPVVRAPRPDLRPPVPQRAGRAALPAGAQGAGRGPRATPRPHPGGRLMSTPTARRTPCSPTGSAGTRCAASRGRPAADRAARGLHRPAARAVPRHPAARRGCRGRHHVRPYGRIVQECLDDTGATARFAPHVVVVAPRVEDLWPGAEHSAPGAPRRPDGVATVERGLREVVAAATAAARRWRACLVFVRPASPGPEGRCPGPGHARRPAADPAVRRLRRRAPARCPPGRPRAGPRRLRRRGRPPPRAVRAGEDPLPRGGLRRIGPPCRARAAAAAARPCRGLLLDTASLLGTGPDIPAGTGRRPATVCSPRRPTTASARTGRTARPRRATARARGRHRLRDGQHPRGDVRSGRRRRVPGRGRAPPPPPRPRPGAWAREAADAGCSTGCPHRARPRRARRADRTRTAPAVTGRLRRLPRGRTRLHAADRRGHPEAVEMQRRTADFTLGVELSVDDMGAALADRDARLTFVRVRDRFGDYGTGALLGLRAARGCAR